MILGTLSAEAIAATFPGGKVFDGPFPWPLPDEEVRAAMLEAYANGAWGKYHAQYCDQLENVLRQAHGVEHTVLCSSGTVAVELALRGGKIAAGDEVLLAAYDFAGNFRAIEAVGARPVLVDLAPATWCLDAALIEDALSPQTKGIVVSHLHGTQADMPAIMEIAQRRNLFVVEDACQAHGAKVAGKPAGSWGDAGVLSFGGSKLITAGRGGAVLTNHPEVKQRITIFADRGNAAYPLSELQAAVLLPQWKKLATYHERRKQRVALLQRECKDCQFWEGNSAAQDGDSNDPAYYKLAWNMKGTSADRTRFIAIAQSLKLPIDTGFQGFTRRSSARCRSVGSLERARGAVTNTVVLHHPVLLQPIATIAQLAQALRWINGLIQD